MPSSLGINLSTPTYYNTEFPFANVAKMSGKWVSNAPNVPYGQGPALALDASGNVTALALGCWASKPVFSANNPPAGNYTILWDGQGTLTTFPGSITVVSSQPGQMVVNVPANCQSFSLNLTATTPGNYLRNLRILLPGISDYQNSVNAWNPAFLQFWSGVACLRFMDWMLTNNSTITSWAGRPLVTDDTYVMRGVPAELLVDLANRLDCDAWFCHPHAADDSYAAGLASLVSGALDPSLLAYVEYSNETWNSIFAQNAYVQSQGVLAGYDTIPWQAGWDYTMVRASQIFAIWKSAFANPAAVVRVLASQASNTYVSNHTLQFQNGYLNTDLLAIAPYVTANVSTTGTASIPMSSATVDAMTTTQFLQYVQANCLPTAIGWMNAQAALAKTLNLGLVAYEGGQSLVGINAAVNDATLTALLEACQTDPLMLTILQEYFAAWQAAGGGLFNYFASVSPWGKFGSWGVVQYPADIASNPPKWAALQQFAAACGQTLGG